jgi:hypothetical protein
MEGALTSAIVSAMDLAADMGDWLDDAGDWFQDAGWVTAWVGLVLSVVAVAGNVFRRRRVRAAGPMGEARSALLDARRAFRDIANEPRPSSWFLRDDQKGIGERLTDVAPRVGDAELRAHIEAAAKAWNDAWAISPPERLATPSFPTADQSRDLQRHQTESDSAHEGLEAVAKALDRLNKLERTIVA